MSVNYDPKDVDLLERIVAMQKTLLEAQRDMKALHSEAPYALTGQIEKLGEAIKAVAEKIIAGL